MFRSPSAALLARLEEAAPGAVAARASDRLAFAHDASHYLLVPQAVVTPRDREQVAALLRAAAAHDLALTFRSGGTSLSGQATNDGVLVDTRRHFRAVEVLDEGARVRVQPGATVRAVNARLARYGRKLGPDPASESACTIGGVVANNSSGMACGTEFNTYRTLESAVLVLPSGHVVDTGAPDADERLRAVAPALHAGLARLRDRVRANPASLATIRRLYAIKNTMGYGLNSLVDHTRPVDILGHLVVGSEGTLAFVAEATFRTVPAHPHTATGLLLFPDLTAATGVLPELVAAGLATVELLDATSLRVAQRDARAAEPLRRLAVERQAALLVEYQEPTAEALADRVRAGTGLFATLPLEVPGVLSDEPAARAALWHIRKGLYAAVAGARPSGTTALLEDIAVPVDGLLPTCVALTELFRAHDYTDSVIFGHAKDGNLHFLLNESFDRPELRDRYLAFTEDLVDLVLGQGGTLKAEHGTGRMMAPYLRRQYGDELYDVMREIKRLVDPRGLLNPGVLLNDDEAAHVSHLKSSPTVEEEVDRCVECGYCEPVCPSQDLTTSPRRRIVLRREAARARAAGDTELLAQLEREYRYDAVETCAVDGMCRTACPVLIDTGDLTRRLRAEGRGRAERALWATAARHWDATTVAGAAALTVGRALPNALPRAATAAGRALLGHETVPAWSPDLPAGGSRRRPRPAAAPRAVFFPSCVTTLFGPATTETGPATPATGAAGSATGPAGSAGSATAKDTTTGGVIPATGPAGATAEGDPPRPAPAESAAPAPGVRDAFLALCARAGVEVRVPERIGSLCCGTPWKSKGLTAGHQAMRARVVPLLLRASDQGALPVVVDAASCTEGLAGLLADAGVRVIDAVEFVDTTLLPLLPAARRIPSLVVHPTCSSTQLGLNPALFRVAAAVADEVIEPEEWRCCAFAGDRGLLHPELTASATAAEARAVRRHAAAAHASVNRTCELGMTRATGHPYRHLLELLDQVTRPAPGEGAPRRR
ncbi:FAD-binding and (Fe-S)-binding domain-containing protein [Streptomyces sp. DSM 44915]|uniref:D-lactate dehydrogenase (cytochrome) n=1 Tax=Streptomyces chisholmiae TaxID=3075540 RepID=A0ABU2JLG8_9ACTN|nr:FAD-binding and (Fe-S)-binding domain-containing protein [Streptomyces sp. DSM 44915]MDT0265830.1 FAD-binding and (Fe-S)-binding domain-containing protein [Streptomyces sp. DSM 44915]